MARPITPRVCLPRGSPDPDYIQAEDAMPSAEPQTKTVKSHPMTQKTSANVSVVSSIMVIVAVLAFYTTAATRSQQISDDVSALAAIVASGSEHRRENRDILMEIRGQVAVLAASHISTDRYVGELREEVRNLKDEVRELKRGGNGTRDR